MAIRSPTTNAAYMMAVLTAYDGNCPSSDTGMNIAINQITL